MVGYDIIKNLTQLILNYIVNYYLCIFKFSHQATPIQISLLTSTSRRISSARQAHSKPAITYAKCELDSHADTTVAGSNCVILHYTGKECDVTPYRDDYQPVSNIPIVTAATAWQSSTTGQTYILIFNEALWMGESMDSTLINPNQLRHYGTFVQDNPMSDLPLSIITEDSEFSMDLTMAGTIVYADTFTPSELELQTCPHITLTSPTPWDPHNVCFRQSSVTLDELVERKRQVSMIKSSYFRENVEDGLGHTPHTSIFNLDSIKRSICSMSIIPESLTRDNAIDPGTTDAPIPSTFQSSDRHSDVTPQSLSERWGISLATASKTLKNTTQRFSRSAVLPLGRRYRTDRMFTRKTLSGDWSTDTMDGHCKTLDGNKYAQVFANKSYFSRIYPMDSKKKAGNALRLFCQEFGVPERLTFDGSKEQSMPGTEFMKQVRQHDINHHISEPDLHNQNPVEGCIRELRRKWYRIMIKKRIPQQLWDYGLRWISETSSLTHTTAGVLGGTIPLLDVSGETPDISEYLDFGLYDEVWYKDNAGTSPYEPGRWLGVSQRTGRLMTYYVLTQRATVISRSTVQRVTNLELSTTSVKETFRAFDTNIHSRFKTDSRGYEGDKPNPEDWADLIDTDVEFQEEFQRVYNDTTIKEADDYTADTLHDTYLHMEVALPRDSDGPEYAKVTKRLRDANGLPIGTANDNPILDTRLYEVEYLDGYKSSLTANTIAENIFSQVDEEGNRYVLLDAIIDHRVTGNEIQQADAFIVSSNGGRRRKETTKGWEILLQWKDGSTTWETMKDVKAAYPVQLAEYAHNCRISSMPAFAWWVPFVLKKRNRIISKIKTKYWVKTHKFGIRIPKNVAEAQKLDTLNGNTLWWDAICKEMKNIMVAFDKYDSLSTHNDAINELIMKKYQQVDCHMIFDVKMGENFRRKARMVAGGHQTTTPNTLTYASVVSRDSVRIALTLAALNGLDVLACDIQNAYLTAPCREKIFTVAGPEFGSDCGQIFVITRALYGLKSSGAAFRSFLAEHLHDIGYTPSKADPDVWMRPGMKPNGFKYWEYVLVYVDDILSISHDPKRTMNLIKAKFKLKNDQMEPPETYLGATLSKLDNIDGDSCWAMSSDDYCAAFVTNVEESLMKKGLRLPSKCATPTTHGYKPEDDCTGELKADGIQRYQELIGSLRWAIELGRVDILLETSLLSKHLAMPREGHLEQALHVVGFLKSHKKLRLLFDSGYPTVKEQWFSHYDWMDFYRDAKEAMPPNMPESRGLDVSISVFVDANHAGDKSDRRSQTGILIFINKSPVHWYSKKQNTVEASTFGAEFCAMRTAVEMIEALRYKLRMFGVPIDGPANVYCDNEAVYKNTTIPESVLKKKHHSIAYHRCREAVASKTMRVAKQGTTKNLADLFTKILTAMRRNFLLERFTY